MDIDNLLIEPTSFFWKQNRIKTFNNWLFKASDKCNAKSMAAAGFYVIGDNNEPDLVECFICGKQLDGWEAHDDPWNEHVKHQSSCPFVKLNKQDESEWTVHEMYELYKKYEIKKYMNELDKKIITLRDEAATLKINLLSAYKTPQENKKNIN
ncbi:baculoviral IAP repeat-containing protein 5 [Camponotus floridanus]|uniref:baculoviral IAP repeat-containing protein 5 n=1 Tax=Camponotus floridanus TaxID=104421 RepID=UPI00059E68A1|nr:baculoviral IAP repeat-containing protein 5 [Camponotus floridanus]